MKKLETLLDDLTWICELALAGSDQLGSYAEISRIKRDLTVRLKRPRARAAKRRKAALARRRS